MTVIIWGVLLTLFIFGMMIGLTIGLELLLTP